MTMTPRTTWSTQFTIERRPRPKNSRKPVLIAGAPRMITDPAVKREQGAIAALIAPHAPPRRHEGPVGITLTTFLQVPVSWPVWRREAALSGAVLPTARPDLDNLCKLILDAMTASGRWWIDDAQVVKIEHEKVFADLPGTLVAVRFLEELAGAAAWKAIKAERMAGVLAAAGPRATSTPILGQGLFGDPS